MLILGLDGATWEVIRPNLGRLPTFARLLSEWESGTIHLAQKPWSASVWTSMFTGLPPEEHGHRNFVRDGGLVRREDLSCEFLWDRLAQSGRRVVAANIPFVMPPYNFQVEFEPPGEGLPITREECEKELQGLSALIRELYQDPPELVIGVFSSIDRMSHLYWGRPELLEFYEKTDAMLSGLVALDPQTLLISDHGFCDYEKAPVQTLPKVTPTGTVLRGDHHPDAIWIRRGISFPLEQPMDVFHGVTKSFSAEKPVPHG